MYLRLTERLPESQLPRYLPVASEFTATSSCIDLALNISAKSDMKCRFSRILRNNNNDNNDNDNDNDDDDEDTTTTTMTMTITIMIMIIRITINLYCLDTNITFSAAHMIKDTFCALKHS